MTISSFDFFPRSKQIYFNMIIEFLSTLFIFHLHLWWVRNFIRTLSCRGRCSIPDYCKTAQVGLHMGTVDQLLRKSIAKFSSGRLPIAIRVRSTGRGSHLPVNQIYHSQSSVQANVTSFLAAERWVFSVFSVFSVFPPFDKSGDRSPLPHSCICLELPS